MLLAKQNTGVKMKRKESVRIMIGMSRAKE